MRTLALAALTLLAAPLSAHDFWLEPSTFRPAPDARVDIELRVGERFVGEPVTRQEKRIVAFVAVDYRGREEPVLGIEGRAPAGLWKARAPGLHVLGYRTDGKRIDLEAAKFEQYLTEEGLEHVIADRRARGESAQPGRELYARCARALVVARGEAEPAAAQLAGWDRALGFPLEIVPEANPCTLGSGAKLTVRVVFRGEPLADALVGCMARSEPDRETRLRTDAAGRVAFEPRAGGVHLVRVVHMTRAAAGAEHEWESQWGSLTFELPARVAAR